MEDTTAHVVVVVYMSVLLAILAGLCYLTTFSTKGHFIKLREREGIDYVTRSNQETAAIFIICIVYFTAISVPPSPFAICGFWCGHMGFAAYWALGLWRVFVFTMAFNVMMALRLLAQMYPGSRFVIPSYVSWLVSIVAVLCYGSMIDEVVWGKLADGYFGKCDCNIRASSMRD